MKKIIKKFLWGTGIFLSFILLVVIVLAFIFFFQKNLVKNMAEKYLKKNTGIPVQIEKLNYSLFPLSFDMENSSLLYNIGETQIKIEMERLSGQGNIHRLRKGQKPYLDTLLVRGLEADVLIKTTGKVIYWHDLASDLSHILSFVRYLDLENSYIKLRFDDGEVIAKQLNFSLYPGDKEGNFLFMLNAPEISASVNQALSGISGQLNISGLLQLSEAPSLFTSLYLDVTSLSFENQSIELDKPIEGKLKLYLPPEENVLSLKVYQLSLLQLRPKLILINHFILFPPKSECQTSENQKPC